MDISFFWIPLSDNFFVFTQLTGVLFLAMIIRELEKIRKLMESRKLMEEEILQQLKERRSLDDDDNDA